MKKNDKKKTTHPNGFLKTFKVKSIFFFKSNTLCHDKVDLLVSPIFEILSLKYFLSYFEISFFIFVLFNLSYVNDTEFKSKKNRVFKSLDL